MYIYTYVCACSFLRFVGSCLCWLFLLAKISQQYVPVPFSSGSGPVKDSRDSRGTVGHLTDVKKKRVEMVLANIKICNSGNSNSA